MYRIFLFLITITISYSQTYIGGDIYEDTTLTSSGNPYYLNDDLYIGSDVTLTIDQGVEIYILGNNLITVEGNLMINGAEESQILFEPISGPSVSYWHGIEMLSGSVVSMNYVSLNSAQHIIYTQINDINLQINNSNLSSSNYLMLGEGSNHYFNIEIYNSLIDVNYGIHVDSQYGGCSFIIENNDIYTSRYFMELDHAAASNTFEITNNYFEYENEGGHSHIKIWDNCNGPWYDVSLNISYNLFNFAFSEAETDPRIIDLRTCSYENENSYDYYIHNNTFIGNSDYMAIAMHERDYPEIFIDNINNNFIYNNIFTGFQTAIYSPNLDDLAYHIMYNNFFNNSSNISGAIQDQGQFGEEFGDMFVNLNGYPSDANMNIYSDPIFDGDSYHLSSESPCIDAGYPGIETDLDGTINDIGYAWYDQIGIVFGCTDENACNYSNNANVEDDSCEYPEDNYDCQGNCLSEIDCNGICAGDDLPQNYYDCFGNCLNDSNGNGICDEIDQLYLKSYAGSFTAPGDTGTSRTIVIDDIYELVDLNILLNIPDYNAPLEMISMYLESPTGTIINFINLGDIANCEYLYETVLDSDSETSFLSGSCPYYGSYFPTGDLESFNGENLEGIWTLTVINNYSGDVSIGYSLIIESCDGEIDLCEVCNGDNTTCTDDCGVVNGDNSTCSGCTDEIACNYDSDATLDNGICEYAFENFDCDSNCIVEVDCYGSCGGSAILDDCGVCNGGNADMDDCGICFENNTSGCTDESACNYNGVAFCDDGSCTFAEQNFDCEGNCLFDFDCEGTCGGLLEIDECGECGGDNSSCSGCMNEHAINYDPDATIDDGSCYYQTQLSGTYNNEIFTSAGNPHIVTSDVFFTNVTIEEGVEINVAPGGYKIWINLGGEDAQFIINGTEQNPVLIQSMSGAIGSWEGITKHSEEGTGLAEININYLILKDAQSGISFTGSYDQGDINISNSTFSNSNQGIYFEITDNGDIELNVNYSSFIDNIVGLKTTTKNIKHITNCNFLYNDTAIIYDKDSPLGDIPDMYLSSNIVAHNTNYGILFEYDEYSGENPLYDMNFNGFTYNLFYNINGDFSTNISSLESGFAIPDAGTNLNGDSCDAFFNLYTDPFIVNQFYLSSESPCIDAGDFLSPYDPDGTIADIGANYYNQNDNPYILGCTDEIACNYDAYATIDNGECEYAEANYDCDGNCLSGFDCNGICGGDSSLDDCGVCDGDNTTCTDDCGVVNGDNSTCSGCMDETACNYDSYATLDNGICEYAFENFDCDGNCIADVDCLGECGGDADYDNCDICNGDNSTCTGCTDPIADNYNVDAGIDDGSCDYTNCVGCAPEITFVEDIPNDQGGRVYVAFNPSILDDIDANIVDEGCSDNIDVCLMLNEGNLDYLSTTNIAQFQFNHNECIVDASGGDAGEYEFTISTLENTILGFSLEGGFIPAGNGTLLELEGSVSQYCISNLEFIGQEGEPLSVAFDSLSGRERNETYTVQRLDNHNDEDVWVTVVSGPAYNADEYIYEATTNQNNSNVTFRVIASMDQGIWISENSIGSSLDNIAPPSPNILEDSFDVAGNTLTISWDDVEVNDLAYYSVYSNYPYLGAIDYANPIITELEEPIYQVTDNFYCENYSFIVTAHDINGNESLFSNILNTGCLSNELTIPEEFSILGCYPNPFNPTTTVTYQVPEFANISIDVYNMNGQLVESLYKGFKNPGEHSINWNASNVTSGAYLITMTSGSFVETQKVMLLK